MASISLPWVRVPPAYFQRSGTAGFTGLSRVMGTSISAFSPGAHSGAAEWDGAGFPAFLPPTRLHKRAGVVVMGSSNLCPVLSPTPAQNFRVPEGLPQQCEVGLGVLIILQERLFQIFRKHCVILNPSSRLSTRNVCYHSFIHLQTFQSTNYIPRGYVKIKNKKYFHIFSTYLSSSGKDKDVRVVIWYIMLVPIRG